MIRFVITYHFVPVPFAPFSVIILLLSLLALQVRCYLLRLCFFGFSYGTDLFHLRSITRLIKLSNLIMHIHRLVDKDRSRSTCKLRTDQQWLGILVIRWILTRAIKFKNLSYKYATCAVTYWLFCLVVLSLKKTSFAMQPNQLVTDSV